MRFICLNDWKGPFLAYSSCPPTQQKRLQFAKPAFCHTGAHHLSCLVADTYLSSNQVILLISDKSSLFILKKKKKQRNTLDSGWQIISVADCLEDFS